MKMINLIKTHLKKFCSKRNSPQVKKLELPSDFLTLHDHSPNEVLSASGMQEIFRFENTFRKRYEKPEVIAVGLKDSDVYFAYVLPDLQGKEKYQGAFVFEKINLALFCKQLERLLKGDWNDVCGQNMIYAGKDRIIMTTAYPKDVPMVWFRNYRHVTIEGELSRLLDPTITRLEAPLLLKELNALVSK